MNEKVFLAFGILTCACGIACAFFKPMVGISGGIVGLWVAFDNYKKLKGQR